MFKNEEYGTVQTAGFITYCDALIARATSGELEAYLFSLIGTPSHIKASSAVLSGGETCRISTQDEPPLNVSFSGAVRTCRIRKIGETVNKIMVSENHFPETCSQVTSSTVVFGPDISLVQERAFLRLDAATSIPLKPQWQGWLWDEILQPEILYSFGGDELREAYLITWPVDDTLQEQILEGVKQRYLT